MEVINAINGTEDLSIGNFVEDIAGLFKSFFAHKFSFIYRNLNRPL